MPPALITEYCARGSLYDVLRSASSNAASAAQLTWARRLAMVRGPAQRGGLRLFSAASRNQAKFLAPQHRVALSTPTLALEQAIDAATGLVYLHGRSIVHRDGAHVHGRGARQCWWCVALASADRRACVFRLAPSATPRRSTGRAQLAVTVVLAGMRGILHPP